jgi:hypothetical protein
MTITGTITSLFFVGGSTGGMVLPWLIGQLFEPVGPSITIVIIMMGVILNLGIYSMIRVHTQRAEARTGEQAVAASS